MNLSDIFTRTAITAGPKEPLAAIARQMDEHNVGAVVIVDDQRPIGIITDRDLALALGGRGVSRQAPVETVMSIHVMTIPDDSDVLAATRYIRECSMRRLPIVDRDDRVMVTLDDLVRHLGRELSNLAEGIDVEMQLK